MTPLIQQMAKITSDAHKFMWFDISHIPYVDFTQIDGDILTRIPFERTAVCGMDADNKKFAMTLIARGDSVTVGGLGFNNNGQLHFLRQFVYINENGTVRFDTISRGEPPLLPDKCMQTLAIIDHFVRSLNKPAEAYAAAPEQTFINRVRMKKGKAALSYEWRTVTVQPSLLKNVSQGGTHASPRLHDRRGHWRVRNGKKHWVRACVVGDPDKGVVEKDYRVGHA